MDSLITFYVKPETEYLLFTFQKRHNLMRCRCGMPFSLLLCPQTPDSFSYPLPNMILRLDTSGERCADRSWNGKGVWIGVGKQGSLLCSTWCMIITMTNLRWTSCSPSIPQLDNFVYLLLTLLRRNRHCPQCNGSNLTSQLNSEHRKMRAKQQHDFFVCVRRWINIWSIPTGNGF